MKKTMKASILKSISLVIVVLTLTHTSSAFAISSYDMVKYDATGKFLGLSDKAKKLIQDSRPVLIERKKVFSTKFKQFDSIYHASHLTRLLKGNMFLYGPPGGAKSYFLDWLLKQESPFKIQMHQMMTEQVFIGGQDYDAARKGIYITNQENSLADHKVALIDEIDKGNPAVLAALLSLLNERAVFTGHNTFKSPLETIFSTSNKNPFEIYDEFFRNGQSSTADALLNRFTCIAFIPNWLDRADRLDLDRKRIKERNDALHGIQNTVTEEALILNWDELRALAYALFASSDEFSSILDTFIDKMYKESKKLIKQHTQDTPPYYPTTQYTERLRQKVVDTIIMSLFLDFLSSDLAKDVDSLEETLKNTPDNIFHLTPLSIWRACFLLTTISYGKVELVKAKDGVIETTIDFGKFLESYEGPNENVDKVVGYIKDEYTDFKAVLGDLLKENQQTVKDAASSLAIFKCLPQKANKLRDIERMLLFYNTGEIVE